MRSLAAIASAARSRLHPRAELFRVAAEMTVSADGQVSRFFPKWDDWQIFDSGRRVRSSRAESTTQTDMPAVKFLITAEAIG